MKLPGRSLSVVADDTELTTTTAACTSHCKYLFLSYKTTTSDSSTSRVRIRFYYTQANSASYPLWERKWVPTKVRRCAALEIEGMMAHSIRGWTCGWQVNLWSVSLVNTCHSERPTDEYTKMNGKALYKYPFLILILNTRQLHCCNTGYQILPSFLPRVFAICQNAGAGLGEGRGPPPLRRH